MFRKTSITLLIITASLCCALISRAQQKEADSTLASAAAYLTLSKYNALWLQGPNAAGLRLDSLSAFGRTQLGYNQNEGAFKLAQQAKRQQQFNLESERLQEIGKTLFYGKFSYTQQWDQQLNYSDVLDPYRGTPYVLADSIGGDWKKQLYALTLKAAGPAFWNNRLRLGIATDLKVGTGARQNDPRPLATNNEISVTPGLTWNLNAKNLIGLNGWYNRYREEVSLEVKNSNINHYLYKSLGLGQLELPVTFTTGASRTYNGHTWGGDFQYQWYGKGISWLNSLGYRSREEEVRDGTSVPRKSGTWKQSVYSVTSKLNLDGAGFLHRITLDASRTEDKGIEFHEFYNTTLKAWQTLLEAEFYLSETDYASISYTLIKPDQKQVFNWLAEIGGNYYSTRKNYLYPASAQEFTNAGFWVKGAKVWHLRGGGNLQTGMQAFYTRNLSNSLSYIPITGDRTLLAREVLYPDQSYQAANAITSAVNMQYDFKMEKLKNVRFAVSGSFSSQHSLASGSYPNAMGNRNYYHFGISALY